MVGGQAGFIQADSEFDLSCHSCYWTQVLNPGHVFKWMLCRGSHKLYDNGEGTFAKELFSEYL